MIAARFPFLDVGELPARAARRQAIRTGEVFRFDPAPDALAGDVKTFGDLLIGQIHVLHPFELRMQTNIHTKISRSFPISTR